VLLDALNRHRGKGQQKVTVEHVHVKAVISRPLTRARATGNRKFAINNARLGGTGGLITPEQAQPGVSNSRRSTKSMALSATCANVRILQMTS
jgi:hypothetical protein